MPQSTPPKRPRRPRFACAFAGIMLCVFVSAGERAIPVTPAAPASSATVSLEHQVLQILQEFGVLPASIARVDKPAPFKSRGTILAALAERGLLPAGAPGIDAAALTNAVRIKVGYALLVLGVSSPKQIVVTVPAPTPVPVPAPAAPFGPDALADGAVQSSKLADGSVTTPKLADAAVTAPKLGARSVNALKIDSLPASLGYVLTADGSGGASWLPPATGLLGAGAPSQLLTVGASGANFTTIQAAINSVGDASVDKPYVILIFPGIYNENLICKDYVHLFGFGSVEYGVASVVVQGDHDVVTMANCNISNLRFNLLTGGKGTGVTNAIKLVNGQNGNLLRGAFSNCYFVVNGDYGASMVKFCEQNNSADIYFESCSIYYRPVSSVGSICFDAINGTINATNLYMNHFQPTGNASMIFWKKGVNNGIANAPDELQLVYFREYPNLPGLTFFVNDNLLAPILINGMFGIQKATFVGVFSAGRGSVTVDRALGTSATDGVTAGTVTKNSDYTATASDYVIRMDATTGTLAVSLPGAASAPGQVYKIKKIDASANAVTIQAAGTEKIDGSNTRALKLQYDVITIQSNGTGWDGL